MSSRRGVLVGVCGALATAASAIGVSAADGRGAVASRSTPKAPSSATGTFACVDRKEHLVLASANGRKRKTLKLKALIPLFSPNGNLIAYAAPQHHENQAAIAPKLFVTDRGGHSRLVVSLPASSGYVHPPDFNPFSWSGDSTRITYVREQVIATEEGPGSRQGLFVADASGGEREVPVHRADVPQAEAQITLDSVASFSPDATTIAVGGTSLASGTPVRGVWLVDTTDGAARLLAALPLVQSETGADHVYGLAWSPDGSRIAVTDGVKGFLVVDGHTGAATPNDTQTGDTLMRWSPDGSRIATAGGIQSIPDLRVVNAAVTHIVKPSKPPPRFEDSTPMWSPDGKLIAFNRTYRGTGSHFGSEQAYRRAEPKSGVFVVPAGGGTARRLIGSTASRISGRNAVECNDWSRR
jgi:Tol biopolymer transport system component